MPIFSRGDMGRLCICSLLIYNDPSQTLNLNRHRNLALISNITLTLTLPLNLMPKKLTPCPNPLIAMHPYSFKPSHMSLLFPRKIKNMCCYLWMAYELKHFTLTSHVIILNKVTWISDGQISGPAIVKYQSSFFSHLFTHKNVFLEWNVIILSFISLECRILNYLCIL